jgi:hypothetical protein
MSKEFVPPNKQSGKHFTFMFCNVYGSAFVEKDEIFDLKCLHFDNACSHTALSVNRLLAIKQIPVFAIRLEPKLKISLKRSHF